MRARSASTRPTRRCGRSIAPVSKSCSTRCLRSTGSSIRFGEGGSLYNTDGWPYRSEMAIRDASRVCARCCTGCCRSSKRRHKTLVLRSWTVGVGQLGRLHIDPRVYDAVARRHRFAGARRLDQIHGRRFLQLSATEPHAARRTPSPTRRASGEARVRGLRRLSRISSARSTRAPCERFARRIRRSSGTYLFTQFGGPLRAGPRTLYPLHGFWLWTDANVFVASHLALDPGGRRERAGETMGASERSASDPQIVDAVATCLNAVETKPCARAFTSGRLPSAKCGCRARAAAADVDLRVGHGGWLAQPAQPRLPRQPRQRRRRDSTKVTQRRTPCVECAHSCRRQCRPRAGTGRAARRPCADALRSLEYQETLFDALAAWRQAFLSYYRWLDTGDADAWRRGATAASGSRARRATRHALRS